MKKKKTTNESELISPELGPTDVYSDTNGVALRSEAGAVAASSAGVTLQSHVQFNVDGSVPVTGGHIIMGGLIPADAPSQARISASAEKSAAALAQSSSQMQLSAYAADYSKIADNQEELRNQLANVTAISVEVAEENTILGVGTAIAGTIDYDSPKSNDAIGGPMLTQETYSDETDQILEQLINAGRDFGSPSARRLARKVNAIKNGVLAQTNDTNPFYVMRKSEMFDRLQLYFQQIHRCIMLWQNIQLMLALRGLVITGAQGYAVKYNQFFNSDIVTQLKDVGARLKSALVGHYYDPVRLADYIEFGTLHLSPMQDGGLHLIIPVGTGTFDTGLAWLITSFKNNSFNSASFTPYLAKLEQAISGLYSGDTSMILAALSSFACYPALTDLQPAPLLPGYGIVCAMQSQEQHAYGWTDRRVISSSGWSGGITVQSPTLGVYMSDAIVKAGMTVNNISVGNPGISSNNTSYCYGKGTTGIVINNNGLYSVAASWLTQTGKYSGDGDKGDVGKYVLALDTERFGGSLTSTSANATLFGFNSVASLADVNFAGVLMSDIDTGSWVPRSSVTHSNGNTYGNLYTYRYKCGASNTAISTYGSLLHPADTYLSGTWVPALRYYVTTAGSTGEGVKNYTSYADLRPQKGASGIFSFMYGSAISSGITDAQFGGVSAALNATSCSLYAVFPVTKSATLYYGNLVSRGNMSGTIYSGPAPSFGWCYGMSSVPTSPFSFQHNLALVQTAIDVLGWNPFIVASATVTVPDAYSAAGTGWVNCGGPTVLEAKNALPVHNERFAPYSDINVARALYNYTLSTSD